jgi:hypothetical protein
VADEERALRQALKRVATTLKAAQVPFALSGGYAAYARGGPEPDHDVDFLVAEEDIEGALSALGEAGLRLERPPEDWLVKVFDTSGGTEVLVDLIHRPGEQPVTRETLESAELLKVAAVEMPVVDATQLLLHKLLSLTDHDCNFGRLLPHARALREQVDWSRIRAETSHSPYAVAFLALLELLDVIDPVEAAP